MFRLNRVFVFSLFIVLLLSQSADAKNLLKTQDSIPKIEIILDASGSMRARIKGKSKISIAKRVLTKLSRRLAKENILLGLRVYGHQKHHSKKYCRDTRLEIPFARPNPKKFKKVLKKIKARGQAPLAYTLSRAAEDFAASPAGKKIIILITDGGETCKGNPYKAAQKLAASPLDVTLYIIGFRTKKKDTALLRRLVGYSKGQIFRVKSEYQLKIALTKIFKKTLYSNLEVKGLDSKGNELAIKVAVFKTKQTVQLIKKTGKTVKIKLMPGSYDLLVKDDCANAPKKLINVKIEKNKITKRKIIFQRCCLGGMVKGQRDRPANGEMTICQIVDGVKQEPKSLPIFKKPAYMHVVPGIYHVMLKHNPTGQTKVFENVKINLGETILKQAKFAKACLGGMATDLKGKPIKGFIKVFSPKNGKQTTVNQGYADKCPKYFKLAPGIYSISITNEKTLESILIKNIKLNENQNLLKTVAFGSSRLGAVLKDHEGNSLEGHLKIGIMNKDKGKCLYSGTITDKPKFFDVAPGKYWMEITGPQAQGKRLLENIILKDGEKVIKQVEF